MSRILALILIVSLAAPCLALAQSSTVTYDDGHDGRGQKASVRKVLVDWTSSSGGAVTITDPEGTNVLGSSADDLADRDTANTEVVYFNITDGAAPISAYPVVCDLLTITLANAGDTKSGQLILYYRP